MMKIKPVRTLEDFEAAKSRLEHLLTIPADEALEDEIEVLSVLAEQFEKTNFPVDPPTPVAAIQFRMRELGWSARQLEPYVGSRARVSEILSGKRSLSIEMIRSLHDGLGIPYTSLISARTKPIASDDAFPSPAVLKLNTMGFEVDQEEMPVFLSSALSTHTIATLHRRTRSQRATLKTDQHALLLWQAAVLQKARQVHSTATFNRAALTPQLLRKIAILSSSQNGVTEAIKLLRLKGITTVVMASLPGTFLDGATMLDGSGQPIIGLTMRHDRTDNFWFTLLHEAAHVLLHFDALKGDRAIFVDDFEISSDDVRENEADELAQTSLIPKAALESVRWNAASTSSDLRALASRARVHLSVVAGRWQRDHQNYRKFSRLVERGVVSKMLAVKGASSDA